MFDISEALIIFLSAVLAVLWTRHWISVNRAGQTPRK
jgi:hypothetical protein